MTQNDDLELEIESTVVKLPTSPPKSFATPRMTLSLGAVGLLSGANGSGKTSYFRKLLSEQSLCSIGNRPASVALLPQDFDRYLYPYQPLWWNISLPLLIENQHDVGYYRARAINQLARFRLSLDLDRYPSALSGGEKHLILFMRLLNAKADLLLLDEPLAALDAAKAEIFAEILRDAVVNDKRHIIMTSHLNVTSLRHNPVVSFSGLNGYTISFATAVFPVEENHHD